MGTVVVTAVAVGVLAGYIWLCSRLFDRLALVGDRLIGWLLHLTRVGHHSRLGGSGAPAARSPATSPASPPAAARCGTSRMR